MTPPQPGPYQQYPQYPQPGGPLPPPQTKPPMPATVRYAFYLMLAGAVLELVQIVALVAALRSSKSDIRAVIDSEVADDVITGFTVVFIVVGVVFAGLWIWMAFANRAGKHWARITGTVFFGLAVLAAPSANFNGSESSTQGVESSFRVTLFSTAFTAVIEILSLLVGLVVIILLWNGRSGAYFRPRPAAYPGPGYPYQGPPPAYPAEPTGYPVAPTPGTPGASPYPAAPPGPAVPPGPPTPPGGIVPPQ